MMLKNFLLFILTLFAAACSQSPSGIQPEQGPVSVSRVLSNGKVNVFCEDSLGHVWIGTFRGLNKYDNHLYHQYLQQGGEDGLESNIIIDLHCDRDGKLWAATMSGTCHLDESGRFHHHDTESSNPNAARIMQTPSGDILLDYVDHFCVLDKESGIFRTVLENISSLGGRTANIAPDGHLWIATLTDLACYDTDGYALICKFPLPHLVNQTAVSDSGVIWLSGEGKISAFNTEQGRFEQTSVFPAAGEVDLIYPEGNGQLLVNTVSNGIYLYDSGSGRVISGKAPDFPYDLPEGHIRCIFRDSRGNMWFGSEDQGFVVSSSKKSPFTAHKYLKDAFRGKSVISAAMDNDGRLWISTLRDGLFTYSFSSKEMHRVDFGAETADVIFPDSHGGLWLLLKNENLAIEGKFHDGRFTCERSFPVLYPMNIAEDSSGRIWISSASRDLLSIRGREMSSVTLFESPLWTFTPAIMPLPAERLLAASYDAALTLVDCRSGETRPAPVPDKWMENLEHHPYTPIILKAGSHSDTWLGTLGNGLFRYTMATGEMKPISGAPCQDISSIEEDDYGNIWVSTMSGLGKLVESSGQFVNYYEEDGTGGNQFYERSSCKLPDGCLLFGGTHGLTIVDPGTESDHVRVPLIFEDLKIHNRRVKELAYTPDISLGHNENGFSISFAALYYGENAKPRYSYKMDGFDKYWVDAGPGNEAYYGNLPPGRYRFLVKATTADRDAVLSEGSINVRIRPPFWRTWWMNIMIFLILALLLWGFLHLFVGMIREREAKELAVQEKAQKERLSQAQMTFFSNIAHEFRTPLTMISGPISEMERSGNISGNDRKLLSAAGRSVNWMLHLVNQMLDFNKIDSERLKLRVSKRDISQTLAPVVEIFSQHAEAKGIDFSVKGLEEPFVMWLDDDKVRKIMMNLLSNAMKFTPAGGSVHLSFDVSPSQAQLIVSDSGCGIPEDQLQRIFERYYQVKDGYNWGSGIGLYYARALASLHHGSIVASNRNDGISGAVFTVTLPVAASSYSEDEILREAVPEVSYARITSTEDENGITDIANGKSVLVADDDVDIAGYLKLILGRYYNVSVCFDAESALKKAKENEFDIVISDVLMPGKSGYELCRALKGDIQTCHIPVILVTAKTSIEEQVQGLDAGADAYVTKPFDTQYLLALVRSMLENRDKIRGQIGKATKASDITDDALSPQDKAFIKDLYALMESTISNPDIDLGKITEMMKMSRTKFYYKVKALTGDNPNVFFRRYKLNRAAQLLLEGHLNVSEIADRTGFSTPSHFSATFKKQFGVTPSEYRGTTN